MTTKVYGVDMEVLQKLYQFQFLLKKRKFGIGDKMVDFLDYVQVHCEKEPIAIVKQVSVAHATILIDDKISVAKYLMARLETNSQSNKVIIKFKKPFWLIGNFVCFEFRNATEKNNFLAAIGDVDTDHER
jgi:hypothetical protein